jgi:aspartate 4-decarboxylase
MINIKNQKEFYKNLSPFELKDKLIKMASVRSDHMILNAGRGNPNWVATKAREAYFLLGNFALDEGRRNISSYGIAGLPMAEGIGERFVEFCRFNSERVGTQFLADSYKYVTEELGINGDAFVLEMSNGILGDNYPIPDRMLRISEKIVKTYINNTMFNSQPPLGNIDIFATEGGTAAMTYIFNTLKENFLINPGDKIAIGTPIFTPYLEIPVLNDYDLEIVEIKMQEELNWDFPDSELNKLNDPSIKAFFIVNPSNPTSTSLSCKTLAKIADLVNTSRKDLIILTDDVYGTFVDEFKSLSAVAPKNTILVYSYSKYYGCTGWRLGFIGINENNIIDEMIAELPKNKRQGIHNRYESISTKPDNIKFIDRLVADSRAVALNHTAGLSTPQQIMMMLFSLQELLDTNSHLYKKEVKDLIKVRYEALYNSLGVSAPELPCYTMYYTNINIFKLAQQRLGIDFANWLLNEHEPIDFVWNLAEKKGIVLMDGGGFAGPEMSVRVSLANLENTEYIKIGKGINDLLNEYHKEWHNKIVRYRYEKCI